MGIARHYPQCLTHNVPWFLKLVSAIFYQIFIFSPKSSFRSRDIQIFVSFSSSFPHFPDSKGQMYVE